MSRVRPTVSMPPRSAFNAFERASMGRVQAAALNATARAARGALARLRREMTSAGLGRLGNGLGAGSDAEKNGQVHRQGGGWSASGWVFIRSGSQRTRGAIDSYTVGADILPKNGRWLWIATDQIPQRAGRNRMTPALYNRMGFAAKIGPLVRVTGENGTPLLIARNVGVNAAGKPNSARSLTKRGLPRKGQIAADFVVAFYAIDRTSRQGRVSVPDVMREAQRSLPGLIDDELRRR